MSMMDAIKTGDSKQVLALLHADPGLANERTSEGVSYVSLAMYQRQPEIARILASTRAQVDLFEACAVGANDRVQFLVTEDSEAANSFSPDGFTPVALAAFFGHSGIVETLVAAGADVNAPSRNTMSVAALHAAVVARDAVSVGILLRNGADPNLEQQGGVTPIQVARAHDDVAIIELLTAHGAL